MKGIFFFFLALTFSFAQAEFAPNNLRYISIYDFHEKLSPFFLELWQTAEGEGARNFCFSNREAFGFNNQATGQPQTAFPTETTIDKLKYCVRVSFDVLRTLSQKQEIDSAQLKELYKKVILAPLVDQYVTNDNLKTWIFRPISSLSNEQKKRLIDDLIERVIGVDSAAMSYGQITDMQAFKDFINQQVIPTDSIFDGAQRIMQILVVRDEFLTY